MNRKVQLPDQLISPTGFKSASICMPFARLSKHAVRPEKRLTLRGLYYYKRKCLFKLGYITNSINFVKSLALTTVTINIAAL